MEKQMDEMQDEKINHIVLLEILERTNKPVYCSDCFRENKPRDSGNDRYSRDDRGSRYSRDDRGSRNDSRDESTTVTCADCGNECTVPFVPRTNKPVYCSDCFRENKPRDSGNDRYSRDDRGSHEMIEVHVLHPDENQVEIILELVNHEMINF
jgi:CxxC-x17-CxxC domain-containing protein